MPLTGALAGGRLEGASKCQGRGWNVHEQSSIRISLDRVQFRQEEGRWDRVRVRVPNGFDKEASQRVVYGGDRLS